MYWKFSNICGKVESVPLHIHENSSTISHGNFSHISWSKRSYCWRIRNHFYISSYIICVVVWEFVKSDVRSFKSKSSKCFHVYMKLLGFALKSCKIIVTSEFQQNGPEATRYPPFQSSINLPLFHWNVETEFLAASFQWKISNARHFYDYQLCSLGHFPICTSVHTQFRVSVFMKSDGKMSDVASCDVAITNLLLFFSSGTTHQLTGGSGVAQCDPVDVGSARGFRRKHPELRAILQRLPLPAKRAHHHLTAA